MESVIGLLERLRTNLVRIVDSVDVMSYLYISNTVDSDPDSTESACPPSFASYEIIVSLVPEYPQILDTDLLESHDLKFQRQ